MIIATKSQDTAAALDGMAASGSPGFAVACAQNGVRNEEAALREFEDVYGICVMAPTAHTDARRRRGLLGAGVRDARHRPVPVG